MAESDGKPRPSLREALTQRIVGTESGATVPTSLRIAAAYAWRLLLVAAALALAIWLIIELKLLVIPLLVAILVTALLWPAFSFMLRHGMPRVPAIIIAVIGTLAIVAGLMWLVGWQVSVQWDQVKERTTGAVDALRAYLVHGPLGLTEAQIDDMLAQVWKVAQEQAELLWSGALAIGSTVGHIGTGFVLSVFILLCLLTDGAGIWRWMVRLFPQRARLAVDGAGRAGWNTLVNYARTQMLVATIDAVGIGLGAFLLGVPLAVPVAVLVFLGSFVPIVGAVVTGALAVFLALVYNGWWIALWMLVVVLGVQQLEGHILQPLLMGSAVKVHPLAVVLVVAGGAMIGGIPGALFAVPLAAFINVAAVYLTNRAWEGDKALDGVDLIWNTVPRTRKGSA
ncbi:AI-2E family transporter [Microbacterium protaetiae]|uniref:AI-2E family transporter n=1 Tax=Microbacterium protaetiae TaxID=2509458 RepID=A0A4P6EF05_9MICO|nr:AI-2E family transporter [Microbacterium protaetiae]QAY60932.1 AI-2E family transporter [Microbacterium protaetiae]